MDEELETAKEVAKATGKLADLIQKAGSFFSKVVGRPLIKVGTILEDEVEFYRYKNLLRIADKVEAIHARRRVEGKTNPIRLRIAIPMLQSASLEEDETLQDLWARLIANSMDPNFKEFIHPGYIEIIKQLSTDEAIILNSFRSKKGYPALFDFSSNESVRYRVARLGGLKNVYDIYLLFCKALPLKKPGNARIYLDNLQRLQIVQAEERLSPYLEDSHSTALGTELVARRSEYLTMTEFGTQFIEVCINDGPLKTST
jgi:hypothetical protein